jgi:hypothetical protein
MLQTQSECSCDYYNVYSLQFFKSLGQLTAGLLSTAVVVPMYTYYSRYFLSNNNNNNNDNHVLSEHDVDDEESDLSESEENDDVKVESDSITDLDSRKAWISAVLEEDL